MPVSACRHGQSGGENPHDGESWVKIFGDSQTPPLSRGKSPLQQKQYSARVETVRTSRLSLELEVWVRLDDAYPHAVNKHSNM